MTAVLPLRDDRRIRTGPDQCAGPSVHRLSSASRGDVPKARLAMFGELVLEHPDRGARVSGPDFLGAGRRQSSLVVTGSACAVQERVTVMKAIRAVGSSDSSSAVVVTTKS